MMNIHETNQIKGIKIQLVIKTDDFGDLTQQRNKICCDIAQMIQKKPYQPEKPT